MLTHWDTAVVLVAERQRDLRLAADRSRQARRRKAVSRYVGGYTVWRRS
jgi:hypothetical protein